MEFLAANTFPKNIRFEKMLGQGLPLVLGDPTEMHQVLLNLCINARDAMPDGGRLFVKLESRILGSAEASRYTDGRPGHFVALEVSDTGQGMTKDEIERAFDPFYTTKAPGKGTGLGLPTVLGIVKSHEGFIGVESTPGIGTTLTLFLPAQQDSTEPPPNAPRQGLLFDDSSFRGPVLVIDDEAHVAEVLVETLRSHGIEAASTCRAPEGLELLDQNGAPVRLVICDITMPDMDGFAFYKECRMRYPEMPILLTTGLTEVRDEIPSEGTGPVALLRKPFGSHDLMEAVGKLLALPKNTSAGG